MKFHVASRYYYTAVTDDKEEAIDFFANDKFLNIDILEAELTNDTPSKYIYNIDVYKKDNIHKIHIKERGVSLNYEDTSFKELIYGEDNLISEIKKYSLNLVETNAYRNGELYKVYYQLFNSEIAYYSKTVDTVKNIFRNGTIIKYKKGIYKVYTRSQSNIYLSKAEIIEDVVNIKDLIIIDKATGECKNYIVDKEGNYNLYSPKRSTNSNNILNSHRKRIEKCLDEFVMDI